MGTRQKVRDAGKLARAAADAGSSEMLALAELARTIELCTVGTGTRRVTGGKRRRKDRNDRTGTRLGQTTFKASARSRLLGDDVGEDVTVWQEDPFNTAETYHYPEPPLAHLADAPVVLRKIRPAMTAAEIASMRAEHTRSAVREARAAGRLRRWGGGGPRGRAMNGSKREAPLHGTNGSRVTQYDRARQMNGQRNRELANEQRRVENEARAVAAGDCLELLAQLEALAQEGM
jgi:hypothetical protein